MYVISYLRLLTWLACIGALQDCRRVTLMRIISDLETQGKKKKKEKRKEKKNTHTAQPKIHLRKTHIRAPLVLFIYIYNVYIS